ncbi:MAG: 4'-phosphopantetheinyl transferase superfamily protein [Clostridiales bacterium]|nr:4'-phosphopantetheinyl transferase superfamily protein [Clostridiales bacterium]
MYALVQMEATPMNPEVFAVELEQGIDASTFDFLLQFVQEGKREHIHKMKIKRDKDLSLTGDILAKLAIKKVFGIPFAEIKFDLTQAGKPYVFNRCDVHFNISHSGNRVVCAVHDKPVGIDIQKMKEPRLEALAKRFFTQKEQECFFSTPPDTRKVQFFKIWTAKESYIKFLGTGMKDVKKDIDESCVIRTSLLFPDYVVSICHER